MLWLVMPASGSCQLLPGLSSASSGPIAINQPVGRGPLGWPRRFNAVVMSSELFNITALDEFDLDKSNPKIALRDLRPGVPGRQTAQAAVRGKPARRPCRRALGACIAGLI